MNGRLLECVALEEGHSARSSVARLAEMVTAGIAVVVEGVAGVRRPPAPPSCIPPALFPERPRSTRNRQAAGAFSQALDNGGHFF